MSTEFESRVRRAKTTAKSSAGSFAEKVNVENESNVLAPETLTTTPLPLDAAARAVFRANPTDDHLFDDSTGEITETAYRYAEGAIRAAATTEVLADVVAGHMSYLDEEPLARWYSDTLVCSGCGRDIYTLVEGDAPDERSLWIKHIAEAQVASLTARKAPDQ